MKQAQLIDKVRKDFSGAVQHWADRMAIWAFVHNDRDGLPPEAFKVIQDLSVQAPGGFRQRYTQLKALPGISDDEIFGSLQDHTRGSEPLSDPGHQAAVLAVMSYFFERCDIFEDKPGGHSP